MVKEKRLKERKKERKNSPLDAVAGERGKERERDREREKRGERERRGEKERERG